MNTEILWKDYIKWLKSWLNYKPWELNKSNLKKIERIKLNAYNR